MSARLRGHYRIDEKGRVESLADVNSSALLLAAVPQALPRSSRSPKPRHKPVMQFCIAGLLIAGLGAASMVAMPFIRRAVEKVQIAQIAAARLEVRRAHAIRMGRHPDSLWQRDSSR